MNAYYVIAIWVGMALLASAVSIKIAVPAALVEIVVGALAGNIPGIQQHVTQTNVVTFLASAGSLVLTFLAGAEIDPVSLRGHWKARRDRRYRAEHHVGGGGLRGDGGDRAQPA
jgi:Kef-type K+ transport system membrane component KefB